MPQSLKQKKLYVFLQSALPKKQRAQTGGTTSKCKLPEPPASPTQAGPSKSKTNPKAPAVTPIQVDEDDNESDVAAIHFEPKPQDTSDDPESADQSPPPKPKAKAKKRVTRKRRAVSEEKPSESSSDEPQSIPTTWKGKARNMKGKRKHVINDSDEDIQPKRRKLVKGVRPPTPDSDSILDDSSNEERIIKTRLRARDKKTVFQKHLEKLKRKKQGLPVKSSSSSSGSDTDSSSSSDSAKRDDEESDNSLFDEPKPEVINDENFIVDDDGAPPVDLPAQFSMSTYQDLAHHFKVICQLFVHVAVQKPDDRWDFMDESLKKEYFSVPLHITRRKIDSIRDSLVASSVWRPGFKKSLEKYPEFEITEMTYSTPGCEACHLGGRISTLEGRLSGQPYDRIGFETIVIEESEDSDSDSEAERKVLKKVFALGKFCGKRTRVFHRFMHWEYELFKVLLEEVENLRENSKGIRGYVRVSHAQGRRPPEDLSDADGIMDWLDERGIIDQEWHKIKEMMDSAHHLDAAAKKGEED